MPFVRAPDGKGLFYVQETDVERPKKHPCPDCTFCLMCNDHRCATCLAQKGQCGRADCRSKTAKQGSQ